MSDGIIVLPPQMTCAAACATLPRRSQLYRHRVSSNPTPIPITLQRAIGKAFPFPSGPWSSSALDISPDWVENNKPDRIFSTVRYLRGWPHGDASFPD
jgi:hypothetical protein